MNVNLYNNNVNTGKFPPLLRENKVSDNIGIKELRKDLERGLSKH